MRGFPQEFEENGTKIHPLSKQHYSKKGRKTLFENKERTLNLEGRKNKLQMPIFQDLNSFEAEKHGR